MRRQCRESWSVFVLLVILHRGCIQFLLSNQSALKLLTTSVVHVQLYLNVVDAVVSAHGAGITINIHLKDLAILVLVITFVKPYKNIELKEHPLPPTHPFSPPKTAYFTTKRH